MLCELAVRNLGVVAEVHLVFGAGMTALTGETGAGKTLIVEAIGLLSGSRADAGVVRDGADEAVIEGRFTDGDDEIVVTRVIPARGRSRSYVDGRMATVATLGALMTHQVDLHAQHAHQVLLSTEGQRSALDRFANIDLVPLAQARSDLRVIENELAELGGDPASREREMDLLAFQIADLDAAALDDPEEDGHLAAEQLTLGDVVAHRDRGLAALEHLVGDGGTVDSLGTALGDLGSDEVFASHRGRLEGLVAEVGDMASGLRDSVDSITEDPERLATVTERRQLIATLRRRYGDGTIEGVIAEHRRLGERLASLKAADGRIAELAASLGAVQVAVAEAAAVVGRARRKSAQAFAGAVQDELRALAMPAAVFDVEVSDDDPGDAVRMMFSANPGIGPAPLSRVASGGELARAMLALRLVATADQDPLVFDEVDAGIGGSAATSVGAALGRVAKDRQVLVVTHLAQVAAAADTQIGVSKTVTEGVTRMTAEMLHGDGRVVELSRMMSGRPTSSAARAHARELLGEPVGDD